MVNDKWQVANDTLVVRHMGWMIREYFAAYGVYDGVIHRVMALPPGVEEASCILAAHSPSILVPLRR